jgi:hypothetical protein
MTKEELEKFLLGLADEVITAAVHWRLYLDLRESVAEYARELNEAGAFWSMTIGAHLMTARSALFRAYDKSPDGLNLPRLLQNVASHCQVDRATINADKRRVSQSDPLVKKFIWQRNNLFAHKNLKNVLNGKTAELKNVLTKGEHDKLLERAVEILNRYDSAIFNHTWTTQMIGHDDFKRVLAAVRQSLELHEKKIQEQIAEYNQKPPQL